MYFWTLECSIKTWRTYWCIYRYTARARLHGRLPHDRTVRRTSRLLHLMACPKQRRMPIPQFGWFSTHVGSRHINKWIKTATSRHIMIWIRHMDCVHGFWRLSLNRSDLFRYVSFGFGWFWIKHMTPPKTDMSPKNWWLEDDSFPFEMVSFQATVLHFQGVTCKSYDPPVSILYQLSAHLFGKLLAHYLTNFGKIYGKSMAHGPHENPHLFQILTIHKEWFQGFPVGLEGIHLDVPSFSEIDTETGTQLHQCTLQRKDGDFITFNGKELSQTVWINMN